MACGAPLPQGSCRGELYAADCTKEVRHFIKVYFFYEFVAKDEALCNKHVLIDIYWYLLFVWARQKINGWSDQKCNPL